MLDAELEAAKNLALKAGEVILEFYEKEIIAEEKLGIDNFYEPVTEADRTASRIIVEGLSAVFPDDYVLSEEERDEPEARLSKRRTWIVDPIDGTAGFVQKDGDFAVQIGLAEDGQPLVGVVYLPFHEVMYFAIRGQGAFAAKGRQISKLRASDKSDFPEMIFAATRNHWSQRLTNVIKEFGFRDTRRRGSVGLKIGLIAESTCDVYIHLSPRTKLWDTCAPQIILEEAGGKLTDIFGSPIQYDVIDLQNYNGIMATNGVSHNAAVEKMRPLLTEFGRLPVVSGRKKCAT